MKLGKQVLVRDFPYPNGRYSGSIILTVVRDVRYRLVSLWEEDTRPGVSNAGWLYRRDWDEAFGMSLEEAEAYIKSFNTPFRRNHDGHC